MAIKLAVLDIAGTILEDDGAVGQAFIDAFAQQGLVVNLEMVEPLMGYKKVKAIEMVLQKLGIDYDRNIVDAIHDSFITGMTDHYQSSPGIRALPGAEDLMTALREQDIRIALNTGFPRIITDSILIRTGWLADGFIDDTISSDEVENGRPDPAMINALMRRFDIQDPSEVMKIGDTEADIKEGRNAGCSLVIAVTTGAFSREELLRYEPDYIIDDLYGVPELIAAGV